MQKKSIKETTKTTEKSVYKNTEIPENKQNTPVESTIVKTPQPPVVHTPQTYQDAPKINNTITLPSQSFVVQNGGIRQAPASTGQSPQGAVVDTGGKVQLGWIQKIIKKFF